MRDLIAWALDLDQGSGGSWSVTVACPLCGGSHVHGATPQDVFTDTIGHRVSHCGRGGYTIRTTDQATRDQLLAETGRCRALLKSGKSCTATGARGLCQRHRGLAAAGHHVEVQAGPFYQVVDQDLDQVVDETTQLYGVRWDTPEGHQTARVFNTASEARRFGHELAAFGVENTLHRFTSPRRWPSVNERQEAHR